MEAMGRVFSGLDVIVGPVDAGEMLTITNFTGHPCLHIRAGFEDLPTRAQVRLGGEDPPEGGPAHRVPWGLSLWSGLFDEAPALRLGLALERALGVAAERPPV